MALALNDDRMPPVLIKKQDHVLDLVTKSLIAGDISMLGNLFNGRLLPLLQNPGLRMASLAQIPPRESDIFVL